jgi:hypothetical protein
MIVGWFDLGVLEHRCECVVPVNLASDTLHVGVGEDVVSVGAALHGASGERGAGIRDPALVAEGVDHGSEKLLVVRWV